MKKTASIIIASTLAVAAIAATDRLWFNVGNISMGLNVAQLDSISVVDNNINVALTTGKTYNIDKSTLTDITAKESDATAEVLINYDGDNVSIVNPYAFQGVDITTDGADVTVNNTQSTIEVVYHITGTTTTGSFKAYSVYKHEVMLDNASITNDNGAAINIQSKKKTTIRVKDGSVCYLCDSKKYNTPKGEDEKATLFSEGTLEFKGKGTLSITGNKKHAICSDEDIELKNTNIKILSAASDGIHVNDNITMASGSITMENIGGDAIDCDDEGFISMTGGTITATVTGDANKGLKASGGNITIAGGTINLTTTGNTTIDSNEPSYCTAIKCGKIFKMTNGDITIKSSGKAGKGISIDGDGTISGGTIDIEVAGAGDKYTTASNTSDSYTSTCITANGNLDITGGTFTLNTTADATGGKCIKVDGALTIGNSTSGPSITATTRGTRFLVSSSSNGGYTGGGNMGGGGNRPGGNFGQGNDNSDYANPKAIKSVGALTINNGTLVLTTSNEGGEGLESKTSITINGGTIEASTYDDCINAATESSSVKPDLTVNGGKIFCTSSNNDAIDSNGTIHINGGIIVALGAESPDCGIDCDYSSNFTLTGGTLVSLAGSNNTPGTSGTTQRVAVFSGSFNTTTEYTFTDANGNYLLSFKSPRAYSSSNSSLMISTPYMTSTGLSIKEYKGATLSDGELFHGLTVDASYSGGTLAKTVTTR